MNTFNKIDQLTEKAEQLFRKGLDAEQVIEKTEADGLAARMIRLAYKEWEKDAYIVKVFNEGEAVAIHKKPLSQ